MTQAFSLIFTCDASHFVAEPSRNFQYFPTALLTSSIVHLCSQCIINLSVSIILPFWAMTENIKCAKSFSESFTEKTFGVLRAPGAMIRLTHFVFLSAVRWLEIFPREQLLLVNGDQLIEDPLSQIRRIEDFLGKLWMPPGRYLARKSFAEVVRVVAYTAKLNLAENAFRRKSLAFLCSFACSAPGLFPQNFPRDAN